MKVFHCDQCDQILFFENSQCVSCGASLAYVPGDGLITALPANAANPWASANPALAGRTFRLCRNYLEHQTCNWAIPSDDDHPYCRSCRLTRVIPDVADPLRRAAWHRLELAKRRLVFTLLALNLPIVGRDDDPASGLSFEFRADPIEPGAPRVFTGHADGVITVNIAEADDSERERRRSELGEPYRTLLGHMRHESGHYYWNRLVRETKDVDEYRAVFGDEREDYGEALQQYYAKGAPADWQSRYVSAYATAHSWEDWAETWAHYLHMVDALETAGSNGLVLRPRRADEPALGRLPSEVPSEIVPFDRLIDGWFSLTYVLNNLNRSMGLADGYPFVLSPPAVEKLRFVHHLVNRAG